MRRSAQSALLAAIVGFLGCSGDASTGGNRSGAQTSTSPSATSSSGGAGTQSSIFSNASPASGLAGDTASAVPRDAGSGDKGCVGSSVTAPPPGQPKADIVWVVDASGSMLDEQMRIGANLTKFADDITSAKLDVHIVMLTTGASIPVICPDMGPDPLAGTKLAGDPRYMFIDSRVDSHNALDIAVDSFSQYQSFLRPDAVQHFVVVSDDESRYRGLTTPADRASKFQEEMGALLGKPLILHAIASEGPTACGDPNCMPDTSTGLCVFVMLGCGAAAPGDTYYELANRTHGVTASICMSDWSGIFAPLTAAVIASAPLPCDYAIPMPPMGQSLDPMKVNIAWLAPGAAQGQVFPRVKGESSCADKLAWYYDVPEHPTKVLLCPNTCSGVANGGTLDIAFGCASVLVE